MITDIILIIWMHAVGDFALQNRWIADNKSINPIILGLHCFLYMIPLITISWQFAIINATLHFPIDFFSSKLTTHYYKTKDKYMFFIVIAIDQAFHYTILLLTYILLKGIT